jgi:hypothetical protein
VTASSSSSIASAVGNGARSVMACRLEQRDSLDYFPTPPWATRALVERVLPHLGVGLARMNTVWECACGEGHMSIRQPVGADGEVRSAATQRRTAHPGVPRRGA